MKGLSRLEIFGVLATLTFAFDYASAQAPLEEVTVTATRRAESIQDVPVSVVAVSGEMINKVGITDIAALTAYIPNVEFASNSIQTNVYVRGIGSGPTHAIEQSVGRFADDVYIGRADMNNTGFMDVRSVEILRGPQGTLFGKNTVAGALIVNTNDPTSELQGGVSATYGEWSTVNNFRELQANISGPLADNVRGRVAVKWRDDGGYIKNDLPGPDSIARRDLHARLKLDWDLSDATEVRVKAEIHNLAADGQSLSEQTLPSPLEPIFLNYVGPETLGLNWRQGIDCEVEPMADRGALGVFNAGQFCPFKDQDTSTLALTINHEIAGVGTLTSITAQQDYSWEETFMSVDNGVSGGTFRAERAEKYDGLSQEFRLTSEKHEKYDYILGIYYEDSEIDRFQRSHFNFVTFFSNPTGNYMTRNTPWIQQTKTIAAFGQLRYSITDAMAVIVGGRYSSEDKDFRFDQFWHEYRTQTPFAGPPAFTRQESGSENNFSPSLEFTWDVGDDSMLFASVREGYKSGGFSDRIESPTATIRYEPEKNTTVELGVKSSLAGGSVTTSATLFHMAIEDMQVASIIPGTAGDFTVTNAAEATSQGLEFEADWQANDNLLIGANLAYTDATYDKFFGPCGAVPVDPQPDGTCNFEGFSLIYAPEFKGSAYADFTVPGAVGSWDLNARGTVSYSGEFWTNGSYQPGEFQSSFTRLDASVRLSSADTRYSFALVGRNLTDEAILDWSILVGPTYFAYLKPPRSLALTFTAEF